MRPEELHEGMPAWQAELLEIAVEADRKAEREAAERAREARGEKEPADLTVSPYAAPPPELTHL